MRQHSQRVGSVKNLKLNFNLKKNSRPRQETNVTNR